MATFHAVTFSERGQGGRAVPVHGNVGNVGVRTHLVQTDPKLDYGGTTVYQISIPISCGSANLATLRQKVGLERELIYAGGTTNALLTEIKSVVKVVDSKDVFFASLDLLVTNSNVSVAYPALTVTFGGTSTAGGTSYKNMALEVTVTHGVEQDAGQAMVVFDRPLTPPTEGGSVAVSMSPDGVASAVFAGTVTGRNWEHFPTGFAVDCRDRMEYTTYPYGGTERTYTSATLGTVVQNLVEAQGIDNTSTSIEDPGWTVGIVEPVVFRRGDRFLPWIREALTLAGYAIFTKGVDSAVYVRPYDESVTGAGTYTLTEGVNILSARRDISRDGIINAVQVDGLTYEGASVSVFIGTANSDVRSPPGTVSANIQSNLIETIGRGTTVALTYLDHHNFKPENVTITTPGTAIEPMDMLVVTHTDIGMSGATVVVTQREHHYSSGGYVTTLHAKRITR